MLIIITISIVLLFLHIRDARKPKVKGAVADFWNKWSIPLVPMVMMMMVSFFGYTSDAANGLISNFEIVVMSLDAIVSAVIATYAILKMK